MKHRYLLIWLAYCTLALPFQVFPTKNWRKKKKKFFFFFPLCCKKAVTLLTIFFKGYNIFFLKKDYPTTAFFPLKGNNVGAC